MLQRIRRRTTAMVVVCHLIIFFGCLGTALGQQSLLAPADYGRMYVLDPATLKTTQTLDAGEYLGFAAVGANSRLAFLGAGGYLSVVDLTLGREVNRIYGVCAVGFFAFTPDQRRLLLEDQCGYSSLAVIDTVAMRVVRKVPLEPFFSWAAYSTPHLPVLGSIIVSGNKAFLTTQAGDGVHPSMVMIDLASFRVKPISIPSGYDEYWGTWMQNAALTTDGKHVVMLQVIYPFERHLYLIDAQTGRVEKDYVEDNPQYGLVLNPVNAKYGYLLGGGVYSYSAMVLDMQTGQPVPGTEVDLSKILNYINSGTISSDGSKLIVSGGGHGQPPRTSIAVIDTALMLTNPGSAIVNTVSLENGIIVHGLTVATITTAPPPTAPTVSSVTPGTITNDTANTLTITGTNFAAGAQVRIGTGKPLPATVINSSTLQVTVPKDTPAQAALDVVVTNPNASGPPAQQYQSGAKAAALTIKPNPLFQPKGPFAAYNAADFSVSVYNRSQGTMLHVPNLAAPLGIAFNLDGTAIYAASLGPRPPAAFGFASYNPNDGTLETQVSFANTNPSGPPSDIVIAAGINPATGGPVMFLPTRTASGGTQIAVYMIDTDPHSPTYNTVIAILPTNNNQTFPIGAVATPDGKHVYANAKGQYWGYIYTMDVVQQTSKTFSAGTLGVLDQQTEMAVSPDGQSLLLAGGNANYGSIMVFDIGKDPMNPAQVAKITGISPPGPGGAATLTLSSFKFAGSRLYAIDDQRGVVAIFNFDRVHSDYTQLAGYFLPQYTHGLAPDMPSGLAVSPDGALLYVPYPDADMVQVLDVNRLLNAQDPLVTNLGAFRQPTQVTVSPVTQKQFSAAARTF